MPLMIDEQILQPDAMGIRTVGQVLSHVRRLDRLVVNLVIDGRSPDLSRLADVRQSPIGDHAVYVETTSPREMVVEVLLEVETALSSADACKADAADSFARDKITAGLDQLRTCFSTWQMAQDSVTKSAQLLGQSPDDLVVEGESLATLMARFSGELREIRRALQDRDYVRLTDILSYETESTNARWGSILRTLRGLAGDPAVD